MANYPSKEVYLSFLKTQIDSGEADALLKSLKEDGYYVDQVLTYPKDNIIPELANYAYLKGKNAIFDAMVSAQNQSVAEPIQIERLKKEIEEGKTVPFTGYRCTTVTVNEEQVDGYMSATHDYGQRVERKEKVADDVFTLSSPNQVMLVNHAITNKKVDVAKKLVVQLSDEGLNKFCGNTDLKETVSNELKRRTLIKNLTSLLEEVRGLRDHYDGKASGMFYKELYRDKKIEANLMMHEIKRSLKELGDSSHVDFTLIHDNSWDFNSAKEKKALKDGKQLMSVATKLNKLQSDVRDYFIAIDAFHSRNTL